ncbi:uncharacterized membrane-anchored protein YitT (DUF2179 family) [Caldicoprobacter guelmensis]|uniref:YitT family protein n=1 Tax=Caldicoprobacter guelmensis TaxID=1170224 RepID=UPI00195BAA5A|nr:YitT family protein [Caldicoprobacter guelmensis]MBM7582964.1 uncharacterized membrane-anchored protein YitT (DUF2179 family) [Caldicoprobacter guelmensis]
MCKSKIGNLYSVIYIIIGSFIYSVAVNIFLIPHKLFNGGLTGIALIFEYLFFVPTEVTTIILNIPLFIGGYRFLGKRFVYLSFVAMISMSVFLSLTRNWQIEVKDIMLASIFGGLISGIGVGIIIKNGGSLGGVNIISLLVNKFFSFDIGKTAIIFNFLLLCVAILFLDIEIVMFSMIGIFISNRVVDIIQMGFNRKKIIIIVSDLADEMAREFFQHIQRGITFLNGIGAYTGQTKKVIYMVVCTRELPKVREIAHRIDPNAFISIIDTREVEGKGFKTPNFVS